MKILRFIHGDIQVGGTGVKIPIDAMSAKYKEQYEKDPGLAQNIKYMIYKVLDRRFIHYKIPSMSLIKKGQQFYYDVVFEFVTLNESDIQNSDILLFSNSPGYAYTYCYTHHHYGSQDDKDRILLNFTRRNTPTNSQLIKELTNKFPPKMLRDPPTVRNPGELALADRTIYFALFHLIDNVPPSEILSNARNVAMNQIITSVASFEKLQMERRRIENRLKETKKRQAEDLSDEFNVVEKDLNKRQGIKTMSGVRSTKKLKPVSRTRSTSTTKSPKSTRR